MRRRNRNPAQRLRLAVEAMPLPTREAMLRGIDANPIVAGAYVDRASGGICPMLAAHRNGARSSLASFARAWDRYTGARRPRLATRRELRTLRVLLVSSIASDLGGPERGSLAEAGARIRAERSANAAARKPAPETGERHRGAELRSRLRWAWVRPARRYDAYGDLLAAAEAELTEARAGDHGGEREPAGTR